MAQTGRTAQEVAADLGPSTVDTDAAAAAEAAGVRSAAFVNYDADLTAYEARSDVENMATRLTREIGPDFAAADWSRETDATNGPVLSTGVKAALDPDGTPASGDEVAVGEGPVTTWPPA